MTANTDATLLLDESVRDELKIAEEHDEPAILADLENEASPADEAQVEHYLRAFRYYTDDITAANAIADAEVARIEAWRTTQTRNAQGALDYLTARLKQFSEYVGRKRRTSPNGVLKWTKGRERVRFVDGQGEITDDPLNFLARCEDVTLMRVEHKVDKAALKHALENGGLPANLKGTATLERGPDSFKVELPK